MLSNCEVKLLECAETFLSLYFFTTLTKKNMSETFLSPLIFNLYISISHLWETFSLSCWWNIVFFHAWYEFRAEIIWSSVTKHFPGLFCLGRTFLKNTGPSFFYANSFCFSPGMKVVLNSCQYTTLIASYCSTLHGLMHP